MSSVFRDVAVGLRTAGPGGFLRQVLDIALGGVRARYELMVIEQRLDELEPRGAPAGVEIRPLEGSPDQLSSILTSRARERFDARLLANRICLVAWRGEDPVGYTWISPAIDPRVEELPLALPPDAAYMWDLFVLRSERGSGIGSALTSARLEWGRQAGYAKGWRAISPTNRPSIRTAEKTGRMQVLGEIRIRRTFGRTRYEDVCSTDRPILDRALID